MSIATELRSACQGHPHAKIPWPHRLLHKSAHYIDQLEAQNTHLREALERLASNEAFTVPRMASDEERARMFFALDALKAAAAIVAPDVPEVPANYPLCFMRLSGPDGSTISAGGCATMDQALHDAVALARLGDWHPPRWWEFWRKKWSQDAVQEWHRQEGRQ